MTNKILILGGTGTIGSMLFQKLSQNNNFDVYGTYFSTVPDNSMHMIPFSLENPMHIQEILATIKPNIVISALRGDFKKQLTAHRLAAEYLQNTPGKLLYFSTSNVFDGDLNRPHYENDTPISDSEYGQFKIRCENELKQILGNQLILARIPFVWGKNSPRMRQVKNACTTGSLEVYPLLYNNHVSDLQIAEYIEWILLEKKDGIFHIGTTDIIEYTDFISYLTKSLNIGQPTLTFSDSPGIMAVLTQREDIPASLKWNIRQTIAYLCQ